MPITEIKTGRIQLSEFIEKAIPYKKAFIRFRLGLTKTRLAELIVSLIFPSKSNPPNISNHIETIRPKKGMVDVSHFPPKEKTIPTTAATKEKPAETVTPKTKLLKVRFNKVIECFGSWLSILLHSQGYKIYGISLKNDNPLTIYNKSKISKITKSYICDILDYDDLKKYFIKIKPDFVIHLAAQPTVLN